MTSNTTPLIRLQGIGKVYTTEEVETHALVDVDLAIAEGEYVAIAGPSGCGKTTLLSILGLLDSPTTGQYELEGRPVASLSPAARARPRNRRIGFMFQGFNLIGELTVSENVELPLVYRGTGRGAQSPREPSARAGRNEASHEPLAEPALGRTAAAGRGGARDGRRAGDPARRRADRKPGLRKRRGGDGSPGSS